MNNIEKFIDYYKKEKKKLDQKLSFYNEKLIIEENPYIQKNLTYFKKLNSDGKLVRGTLVNLGYSLERENQEVSDDLALAYEIFQTAILVHDDIIDKDEIRRNKKTIHFQNYEEYKSHLSEKEAMDVSNAIALCMGDYGLYSANKIISDSYQDNPNLGKVLSYFNDIVLKTIKGELLDVILPTKSKEGEINPELLEKSIIDIYRYKTAYYTIIGPIVCGMLLAGSSPEKIKDIEKFGEEVGIAFQIQDDILGIYSTETGKVKGSDIKEFKQTILYSNILKTTYKEEFLKYYGTESLTEEVIQKIQDILIQSNVDQLALDEMNKRYDNSLKILEDISWIDYEKKGLLKGFIEYLRMRNK